MSADLLFFIAIPKQSRHAPAKYGQFFKPAKAPAKEVEDRHLWLGRALTREEFNDEFPKAIKSLPIGYTQDIPIGIVAKNPEAASLSEIEDLKAKHAEEIRLIQEGVDTFTAEHNTNLRALSAKVEDLQRQLDAERASKESPATPEAATTPAEGTVVEEAAAGGVGADSEPQPAIPEPQTATPEMPEEGAAVAAKKKRGRPPANTDAQ